MKKLVHPIAGAIAMITIATFWLSTIIVELFAPAHIVALKTMIPWGLFILIPSLAATGGTGFSLAGERKGKLIADKTKRMKVIAANGILVLVPSALFLSYKAQSGMFDTAFYTVQALELLAGALNFTLLTMNMKDGLRLKGRIKSNRS